MIPDSVTSFIGQLRQTNLLDAAQLGEVERLGQTTPQLGQLARELVQRGWLTPHQANQIALGRGAALVIGSYVVLAPLRGGGMGQVVKARHRILHRDVALKLIRPDQQASADTLQRFRREIRLLADLHHPYIVQAYDAGQVGDTWFLAMELLEGADLDQLVRRQGPLPVGAACEYLRQAALGLHHAHQRGLVHRDVKPGNLFLTREGIKVLDLGLARPQKIDTASAGDLTRANSVLGTPDYLAPEQALDPCGADARSDLYGLGCTLYFLLTGRPPFPEGTLAQKLVWHQQAEPPPVERQRPDVPVAVAQLLRQMLAKTPTDRPGSALEVAQRLAPFAAPAAHPRPPATEGSWPAAAGGERSGPAQTLDPAPATGERLPSLVEQQAGAPERGWTLFPETMPPTALPVASLVSQVAAPERGFTLQTESLPPRALPVAAPPTTASPARRRWLIAGGAGLLLLFSLSLVWLGGLLFSSPQSHEDTSRPGNRGKTGARKPAQTKPPKKPDGVAVAAKRPRPKGAKKARPLKAKGPKETEGVFLMPGIAPDKELAQRKPGGKIFLSDMHEFAFKTTPTNWPFAKNGRVGDPKDPNCLIRVKGDKYPKGLGMHPPNTDYIRVCYALAGRGASVHGAVALDDGEDRPWQIQTTTFVVLGDGKVLWRSQGIKDRGVSEAFQVAVGGVRVLELRVYTDYNGANGSRAVWLDPYVVVGK
jgi:serine/threonine-protein kinase